MGAGTCPRDRSCAVQPDLAEVIVRPYNLTLPEAQVLVHFGPLQSQTWLMVRMPEPAANSGQ